MCFKDVEDTVRFCKDGDDINNDMKKDFKESIDEWDEDNPEKVAYLYSLIDKHSAKPDEDGGKKETKDGKGGKK